MISYSTTKTEEFIICLEFSLMLGEPWREEVFSHEKNEIMRLENYLFAGNKRKYYWLRRKEGLNNTERI